MGRPKKKSNAGRPTVMTEETVKKLIEAFKLDCTIEEACAYADITKPTFYDHLKKNPQFSYEIEKAREYLILLSRQTVATSIKKGETADAKWYLERKRKSEFSSRQELTGKDGGAIEVNQLSEIREYLKSDVQSTKDT